jgi:hypothetical protein
MKIFEYHDPDLGRVFTRISGAMQKHFKNVEWTNINSDLIIVETLGQGEVNYLNSLPSLDNVVLFQQCFLTSGVSKDTWVDLWKRCKLVVSYNNLDSYTEEKFNFYRTPLGAEPDLFPIGTQSRAFKVFSTGHLPETECLDKVYLACKDTKNIMIHTGEDFRWDSKYYTYVSYLPNREFTYLLQRVQYITGLRLIEGFEMMCIEGAMTGATPIVPFIQCYDWYKDFGLYIDVDRDIVKQLENIFSQKYEPLSKEKIEYVRNEFSWEKICGNIQKKIMES